MEAWSSRSSRGIFAYSLRSFIILHKAWKHLESELLFLKIVRHKKALKRRVLRKPWWGPAPYVGGGAS